MKSFETNAVTYDYSTWQVVQEYIPKDLMTKYRKLFNAYDPDGTGVIRIEDVASILKTFGRNFTPKDVWELLENLIGEKLKGFESRFVDFKEFIAIASVVATNCICEDEMSKIFHSFDRDGDGFITSAELKELFFSLGEDINDHEIEEMIREADQDGDGKVGYDEFVRVMTNSSTDDENDVNAKLSKEIELAEIQFKETKDLEVISQETSRKNEVNNQDSKTFFSWKNVFAQAVTCGKKLSQKIFRK